VPRCLVVYQTKKVQKRWKAEDIGGKIKQEECTPKQVACTWSHFERE